MTLGIEKYSPPPSYIAHHFSDFAICYFTGPDTMAKTAKKTEGKSKKGASAYNVFMKDEMAKIKKADPKLKHQEAFKKAASNWSAKKPQK